MTTLIGIKELAGRLGMSASCLYQWVSQKRIPYIKLGRKVLFDPEKIEEWVTDKEVPERSLD